MLKLIVNRGRAGELTVELADGTHGIGRGPDNAVCILHKSLSRKHAELVVSGESVRIIDLGSKNGTFVNERRIESHAVRPGDVFRCGDVPLAIGAGAAAADPAPELVWNGQSDPARTSLDALVGGPRSSTGTALRFAGGPDGRAAEKLQVLLKVSQLLSSPVEIDVLLQRILDLAFQLLDVDRGAILMVDAGSGELVARAARGATSSDAVFYSTNVVGWVQTNAAAGLFNDARFDPRLAGAESVVLGSICSSMCAPLKIKDKVVGVLYVDNVTTPNRFGEEDLDFLGAFASQAAIAVENADMVRQLESEAALRNALVRFFPPATVKRLEASLEVGFTITETEVTALFSDITGFTEMSSQMRPREVVELLNAYFPTMAGIVFSHEGTLEKYIGDALMAIWGAPFRHPEDARRALSAAVDMQRALCTLNERYRTEHGRELSIHIGLNTGLVAAGNIGSDQYLQYAAIGDATNVASRICSAAGAGEILISGATRAKLGDVPWPIDALPPVPVKGKAVPLDLFRVRWG